MKKTHLLIIDPQNDFMDPNGALYVTGADKDAICIANLIERVGKHLEDIHVTLDTHHRFDVAHPIFWMDEKGNHPDPFTLISLDDFVSGKWKASLPNLQEYAQEYLEAIQKNNRYILCVWPPHCIIGTPGHNVQPLINDALAQWETNPGWMVDFVTKGSNFKTEHYSGVMADVPDPSDKSTLLNKDLIDILEDADEVLLAGEALSHCVANTVRDIANEFGDDSVKKLFLLEDCTSSVPGFENMGIDFVNELTAKGMNVIKSTDY